MKVVEEVNARKSSLKLDDTRDLLKDVNDVYAAKGKKVVHLNLKKDQPSDDELAKALLGPTGNLRAPALRKGKTLIVGFNQELYERFFG